MHNRPDRVTVRVQDEVLSLAYLQQQAIESGRPVVWIHGMGSSRLAFIPLLETAPIPGPYYALDLPGFGASTMPRRRQDIPSFVAALAQFLEAKAIAQPLLVGHSFGGMVAAEMAIAHPLRIGGVVLVDSAGIIPPRHALKPSRWVWMNRVGICLTSLDCFGNRILEGLGLDPVKVSPASRRRMRYGWRHSREMARMGEFYQTPELASRLSASGVPAALIWGSRDHLFPLAAIEREVNGRFPIEVVKGAGHLPYDFDLQTFNVCLIQAYQHLFSDIRQDCRH